MKKTRKVPVFTFWDLDHGKAVHTVKYDLSQATAERISTITHPFKISNYVIRWVKKGKGKALVNHIPYDIAPNLLVMGNPSQIAQFDLDFEHQSEIQIIAFTDELISLMNFDKESISLLNKLSNELHIYPEGNDKRELEMLFETIFFESEKLGSDALFYKEFMAALVRSLIILLLRLNNRTKVRKEGLKYRNLYRSFIHAIDQNFKNKHTVQEYAELLFIHEKTLNRACKSLTGLSASKIIQNRIDFEAKRALVTTHQSVKQIGYSLGFKSAAHFNKYFATINSVTPGEYRKTVLSPA